MTILYFYRSMTLFGGVERILTDKMNYMAEHYGWDITICTYEQGAEKCNYQLSEKVKHVDLGCFFWKKYHVPLWRRGAEERKWQRLMDERVKTLLDELRPDIVVGNTIEPQPITAVRRAGFKCRLVVEAHIYKELWRGSLRHSVRTGIMDWWHGRGQERAARYADVLVALTHDDAALWQKKVKTVVIPNFIHTYPETVRTHGELRRALAVGRLHFQKGFTMLVDVWAVVAKVHPDWRLDIIGDGPDRADIEARIARHGLEKQVRIVPPTPAIYNEYQSSDLLVVSSVCEGFCLVLAEAMASGVPAVSFDCPTGPRDIIDEGTGLLVPPSDKDAMAKAICQMIEHTDQRRDMGEKARQAMRRYTDEIVMPQWKQLFEKLAGQAVQ